MIVSTYFLSGGAAAGNVLLSPVSNFCWRKSVELEIIQKWYWRGPVDCKAIVKQKTIINNSGCSGKCEFYQYSQKRAKDTSLDFVLRLKKSGRLEFH